MTSNGFSKPCSRCKTKYAMCPGPQTCERFAHWVDGLRMRGADALERVRRENGTGSS